MKTEIVILLSIGLAAGFASGLFGIGGGVLIVPALVYLLGFSQHRATGTSLVVLLPPVGLGPFSPMRATAMSIGSRL